MLTVHLASSASTAVTASAAIPLRHVIDAPYAYQRRSCCTGTLIPAVDL